MIETVDSITKEHLITHLLCKWNLIFWIFFFLLLDFKLAMEQDLFTMVGVWCKFPAVGEQNDQREETTFNC